MFTNLEHAQITHKIITMSFILKTNNASYLLDPDNDSLVLKRNGKFSSVYIGYRIEDKQPVVIKKLKNPEAMETQFRFQREAIMGFNFQGVQQTLDAFKDASGYYIIKEFVDAQSLRQLMQTEIPNRLYFIVSCIIALLKSLQVVHREGVFHCDIRPDNVLVLQNKKGLVDYSEPSICLIDFGLCKQAGIPVYDKRLPFSLIYSPPEQLLNFPDLINATTDIYSVGLTLYECLVQYPPFFNENPEMVMHLQLNTPVAEHKKIPVDLMQIIRKATHKKILRLPPAQLQNEEIRQTIEEGQAMRYTSAEQLLNELELLLPALKNQKPAKGFFEKFFS
jgi:serine/threonine protein kinase